MTVSLKEIYTRKVNEIAEEYEAKGYKVLIEPSANDLPEFLAGFRPDIIAQGPEESVVVEIKIGTTTAASERFRDLAERIRREPRWRFSLVVVDTRSDEVAPVAEKLLHRNDIEDRLVQADKLSLAGSYDVAFLLLWSSVEAILRQLANREDLPLEHTPTSSLTKELFSQGVLSRLDSEILRRLFSIRNALVYGFTASGLEQGVKDLTQLTQRLLKELDRPVK